METVQTEESWEELPSPDQEEDWDTKSVNSSGQASSFILDDLEEFKVQLETGQTRKVADSIDQEIIQEMKLLEDSINQQAIANMSYQEKAVKVYLPMLGRLLLISLFTYSCCYLLQSVLRLAYNLVVPAMVISVTWILYSNGGLMSPAGFDRTVYDITQAGKDFFNSLRSIWHTLKAFLNGPI